MRTDKEPKADTEMKINEIYLKNKDIELKEEIARQKQKEQFYKKVKKEAEKRYGKPYFSDIKSVNMKDVIKHLIKKYTNDQIKTTNTGLIVALDHMDKSDIYWLSFILKPIKITADNGKILIEIETI